jgi:hypothetical protein
VASIVLSNDVLPSIAELVGVITLLLILGVTAFVRHETGSRHSNNGERIAFGLGLGISMALSWDLGLSVFLTIVALIIGGQFISAYLLHERGHLERFVDEYLEGATISQPGDLDESRSWRVLGECTNDSSCISSPAHRKV